jgi:hypothetical protein
MNRIETGFRYLFQNVKGVNCGSQYVTIKNDSTFTYSTYSKTQTGKWRYSNDSLVLNSSEIHFKIDSLKKYDYPGSTRTINYKQIIFKVKKDYLIRFLITSTNDKIIEKLKFNAP